MFDPSILPILEPFVVRPGDDQAGRFIYNIHVGPEQLAVKIFLPFSIFCSSTLIFKIFGIKRYLYHLNDYLDLSHAMMDPWPRGMR